MSNAVLELIRSRHCKRHFDSSRQVSREIIEEVLEAAAHAPSTQNTQPWGITVITGSETDRIRREILARYDRNEIGEPEYANRPENPPLPEFLDKQSEWGKNYFQTKNLNRQDVQDRWAHNRDNYTFFNAPTHIIIHIPDRAVAGTFLDIGAFLQNLLIGFLSHGIGSCPQYAMCRYSNVFREFGLLPQGRIMACGLSIGYFDPSLPLNSFIPDRQPIESWVTWAEDKQVSG